jgi:uncharacterized membrane protein YqjE
MVDYTPALHPVEPALGDSLARAFRVARGMAIDELQLLQLELQERARRALWRGLFAGLGAVCLLLAWLALIAAGVVWLDGRLALEARLALVAASQAVIGAGALAFALRARRAGS